MWGGLVFPPGTGPTRGDGLCVGAAGGGLDGGGFDGGEFDGGEFDGGGFDGGGFDGGFDGGEVEDDVAGGEVAGTWVRGDVTPTAPRRVDRGARCWDGVGGADSRKEAITHPDTPRAADASMQRCRW